MPKFPIWPTFYRFYRITHQYKCTTVYSTLTTWMCRFSRHFLPVLKRSTPGSNHPTGRVWNLLVSSKPLIISLCYGEGGGRGAERTSQNGPWIILSKRQPTPIGTLTIRLLTLNRLSITETSHKTLSTRRTCPSSVGAGRVSRTPRSSRGSPRRWCCSGARWTAGALSWCSSDLQSGKHHKFTEKQ
jgi:hypothetical protein